MKAEQMQYLSIQNMPKWQSGRVQLRTPEPNYNLTEAEFHALQPVFDRESARKPEQMQAYYSNPSQQTFAPPEARPTNLSTNATLIAYIMRG